MNKHFSRRLCMFDIPILILLSLLFIGGIIFFVIYLKNKDKIEKNYKELQDKESKKLYNNLLKSY